MAYRELLEFFHIEAMKYLRKIIADKPGDRICILGFAHGANAARKLCAMIDKASTMRIEAEKFS